MALIQITEVDKTQPGVAAQTNEVVYIPGFLGTNKDTSAVSGKAGKTYHLRAISELHEIIGDTAYKFEIDTDTDSVFATAGGFDPSYIMAKEYLNAGLEVIYDVINVTTVSLKDILDYVSNNLSTDGRLADCGQYSIKYVTTGGYPAVSKSNQDDTDITYMLKLLSFAKARGDCIALIDHSDDFDYNSSSAESVFSILNTKSSSIVGGEYGAMFSGWETYVRLVSGNEKGSDDKTVQTFSAPASFAYLTSLADSLQTNPSWLAIAGVARGKVRNLTGTINSYTNGDADYMQKRTGISINGITNIQPYGYTLWGNRTLRNNTENLVAGSFLNIRNLICDVKKLCYSASKACTFEQNSDVLWVNFKSKLTPVLDRMKSGYGINDYKVVRDLTHEKAQAKATLCAKVILYPVEAVEDFYITIVLQDDNVSVE